MSDALSAAWEALEEGLAAEALELLARAEPTAAAWACAALAYLDLEQYGEADSAARRAEQADGEDPDALLAAGEVHLAAWRVDRARAAFTELAEIATFVVDDLRNNDLPSARSQALLLPGAALRARAALDVYFGPPDRESEPVAQESTDSIR